MPCHVHGEQTEPQLRLRRLYPAGEPVTVERLVDELKLPGTGRERPYVMLNMVSTVDGRASIGGVSGAIGEQADKALFHGLRTAVDGVMAGAGTIRAERYRRVVRDEGRRQIRRARGLAEEPLMCIVSGRLHLPPDIPILGEPGARVVVITPAEGIVSNLGVEVEYVRAERHGSLDLRAALSELRERHGVRTLLCEGGPHLNAQLLAAGIVDELFLSLSPKLAGEDPAGAGLRIVAGTSFEPPVGLELAGAFEHESHLFLRYRVAPV